MNQNAGHLIYVLSTIKQFRQLQEPIILKTINLNNLAKGPTVINQPKTKMNRRKGPTE